MTAYAPEYRQQIAAQFLDGNMPLCKFAQAHGIHRSTISSWVVAERERRAALAGGNRMEDGAIILAARTDPTLTARQGRPVPQDEREDALLELAEGVPLLDVAARHGVTTGAIRNWRKGHRAYTLAEVQGLGDWCIAHMHDYIDQLRAGTVRIGRAS